MAKHPDLTEAIELALQFAQFVRQRQRATEPLVRTGAQKLSFQSLPNAYKGYAVKAGMTLHWSNGQTEGQINRLKMLKRQMFGRAGIELLSRRFLLTV